ncbi:MAG: hypothetical protein PHF63_01540 [Herbinix sp.]|nr:hypothetical protein [Herbinix sp.]
MRNSKKFILLLAMCCLIPFMHTDKVEAKSTKVITLEEGKEYNYDLNGDGKKEKIKYSSTIMEDGGIQYNVNVNKKLAIKTYSEGEGEGAGFYLIDIDSKDNYKELYVKVVGDTGYYIEGNVYRYEGNKLKIYCSTDNVGEVAGRFELDPVKTQNGIITFVMDAPFYSGSLGSFYAYIPFKVENGKMALVKKGAYEVSTDWQKKEYIATKTLSASTTMGGKKKAFSMRLGDTFYLLKISVKDGEIRYIKIKDATGTVGWIKVPDTEFYMAPYGGIYSWG